MVSTFTWLDHSDTERQRALDAIDQFKESETRDELGLGSFRDAFADLWGPVYGADGGWLVRGESVRD